MGSRFQLEANDWVKQQALGGPEVADVAFQLGWTAMMLIGYAIEVLAKGLIVARDATDATVKRITGSHVGAPLVQEAGIELEPHEEFLVDQTLYHAVRWLGRYPVPHLKDAQRYAGQAEVAKSLRVFLCIGGWLDRVGDAVSEVDA